MPTRSMAVTTAGRPAPRRERSTPMRRPIRRSWASPRAKRIQAGAQPAMRSRAWAPRALPRRRPELRLRAAPRARPRTVPARLEAAQAPRPEGPTPAAHLLALPRTEAVRPVRPVPQARLPTLARQEAARRLEVVEAVRLRAAAEEAALTRVAAEAARPVGWAIAEFPARPSLETALLSGDARPTSMSMCRRVSRPAAHPRKGRVGPSPRSAAHPERARGPADPSSGWRRAAAGAAPGRLSRQPTPDVARSLAEPRSARQAAPGLPGSRSRCATATRAGRRSCSSSPCCECGGP